MIQNLLLMGRAFILGPVDGFSTRLMTRGAPQHRDLIAPQEETPLAAACPGHLQSRAGSRKQFRSAGEGRALSATHQLVADDGEVQAGLPPSLQKKKNKSSGGGGGWGWSWGLRMENILEACGASPGFERRGFTRKLNNEPGSTQ